MEEQLYEIIINSLSTHVAVLNHTGVIIETNRAWQEFAHENGMEDHADSIGINYLDVCEEARQSGSTEGALVARGIQQVMAGELREFVVQYPCHSPTEYRWYTVRILPYLVREAKRIIVVHEDVTPLIAAQEELVQKEQQLRRKSERLEETNIALKVLLERRDRDLEELEGRIVANIRELVSPFVEKLQTSRLREREQMLVEILASHLEQIVSPFLNKLSSLHLQLTPQEVDVATLVRQGRSSQEIAEVMGISLSTVAFHRRNLRRKLGLHDRSQNLRTYLLSLQ